MPDLKLTILMLLSSLLLAGCVSQRIGVQITSTSPMSMTRVMVNGDAVVVCRVGE
ncbi:hypothetical protein MF265_06645 [Serratia marcescens]|uniref:hypothetical protein n=1 Tax=Serratia marcescens TaxID=615 RepID=UPI001EEFEE20|nr:hypothetical protein [Serratia marcescens]ULH12434.1 hypothetical protein MF265_06645 [Serratia marcescens]